MLELTRGGDYRFIYEDGYIFSSLVLRNVRTLLLLIQAQKGQHKNSNSYSITTNTLSIEDKIHYIY